MKIVVSTHQGKLYDEEIDYVVIHSDDDGEYAIMKDHVPVVSVMNEGFIKLVRGNDEIYVIVISAILEYNDNNISVIAQEAQAGSTKESTRKHLLELRKERLEKNKQETADLTLKEKELREHIKKSGAGKL